MTDGKPGMMLYFGDLQDMFSVLTDEELGMLLRAASEFAASGKDSTFKDRTLRLAWLKMKRAISSDDEKYDGRKKSSAYANYCREEKRAGREPVCKELWMQQTENTDQYRTVPSGTERYRAVENDTERLQAVPNTNTSTSNSTNNNNNTNTSTSTNRECGTPAPSRDEVRSYISEKQFTFDADYFYEWYDERGWPRNWKTVAINWQRKERPAAPAPAQKRNNKNDAFQQHGEISPMMREAIRKAMEEEDKE